MPPLGRLVSHAFAIPHGLRAPELRDVLRAVDSVHGAGIPSGIIVNSLGKFRRLAVRPEIGHFLDHQGIGKPRRFESARRRLLRSWRGAISDGEAYLRLRAMR